MKRSFFALGLISSLLLNLAHSSEAFSKTKKKNKKATETSESEDDEDEEESEKDSSEVRRTKSGKVIRVKKTDEIDSESSEAKREELKFEAIVDLVGFTPSPTSGFSLGLYLQPSQILEFRYGSANAVFSDTNSTQLSIGLKSFWGNSFYTRVGLGQRSFNVKDDILNVNANGEYDGTSTPYTADVSSIGVDLYIGNQWQWDSFTIGADWIGFFLPISTSGPEKVDTTGKSYSSSSVDNLESDLKYARESQSAFIRFFLGFAF